MRKKLFLLGITCVFSFVLCAQNKRLAKIVYTSSYEQEYAELSYDAQDRVILMQMTNDEGKSYVANYSYNDAGEVQITYQYRSGTDTYNYKIADNKIQSEETYLDVDNITYSNTYEYSGNLLSAVSQTMTGRGKTKQEKTEFSWNGPNLSEVRCYSNGELDEVYSHEYNDITTHPLLHFMFGLIGDGYPNDIDDLMPYFALYPYLGTLPQNLWSKTSIREADENRTFTYDWDYTTDAEGNITTVTATHNSRVTKYELSWENANSTGISKTSVKPTSTETYNLTGQRLKDSNAKGIRIIRYADGTVRKVIPMQ